MSGIPDHWPAFAVGLLLIGIFLLGTLYYRQRYKTGVETQAELETRVARAEAMLATAPAAYILFEGQGQDTMTASPGLCAALGLTQDGPLDLEAIGSVVHADDAGTLLSAIQDFTRSGTVFACQARTQDGMRTFSVEGRDSKARSVWFTEVTELVAAREACDAAVEELREILSTLPIPVWIRSGDLSLSDCNRAYAAAVDATHESVLSDSLELLGRSKARQARDLADRALQSGEPSVEDHHVVIDGARRLLRITEQPLPDGRVLGHAIDLTAVEDLQSALKRHTEGHAAVLENLGTAIAIYGADLRLSFYNTAYVRLWGLEGASIDNQPHLGDVLETLRERRRLPEYPDFPAFKKEVIRTFSRLIEPVEQLEHLPDGTTLRMLAVPHPMGGVLFSYEDVTDRLALERSYNTLIDVQRETLNKLYEGVAVYGADGRLKLFNPAFAQIWNLPEEMLPNEPHVREILELTRDFFDVSDEEWTPYVETAVANSIEPEARSGRRERADSSVIDWAQVPLPDGAVLFTFLDVTDSIRVERALLERNEALETTDRLKSEFIANISYELRTPLNAIIGFAEILENQFFGDLNQRQLEYSHAIVESSQRLIALINDILDLASIEAGYLRLERESVEVKDLLDSIYTLGRERAHNNSIELQLDCAKDIGAIDADPRRLKQALFNLLSNALKFTKEDGTITLSAKRKNDDLLLEVSDTGVGIAEEDRERVFGKFERGTGQLRQSGAGLGLSLVKSLIELHGGWVELESAPGEGTRVRCHIPPAAASETTRS